MINEQLNQIENKEIAIRIDRKVKKLIKNRMKELTLIRPTDRTGDNYEELLDLFWCIDIGEEAEYLPYLFDYLIVDEHDEVEGISETLLNSVEECPIEILLPCTLKNLYRYNVNPGVFKDIFLGFLYKPENIKFIKKYLTENIDTFDKDILFKVLEDMKSWNLEQPQLDVLQDLRQILSGNDSDNE